MIQLFVVLAGIYLIIKNALPTPSDKDEEEAKINIEHSLGEYLAATFLWFVLGLMGLMIFFSIAK